MKPQNESVMLRLQQHLPIKARPEAWLTAHKDLILLLLKSEPMGEITQLTGLNSGTIQRWRRKAEAKPVPPVQEISIETDVSYWKGRAEAFHEALQLMAAGRA